MSNFEYTSPTVKDDEGDAISFSFTQGSILPCKCLSLKELADKSFLLKVNQNLVTDKDAGTHSLSVTLKDDKYSATFKETTVVINLKLDYKKLVVQSGTAAETSA